MACTAVNSLQWRQLYQAIASKAYTPQFHGAHAFASHTVIHNSNTTTLRRSFHGTPSRSAVRPSRRSPSARRAKRDPPPNVLGTGSGLRLDREGFFNYILSPDVHQTLATFEQLKVLLYDTAGPMLPPGVNMTTFEHVCRQLIILSHTVVPSASVVRGISIDVDAVYRISQNLSRLPGIGPFLYEWALTGCARAKSRRALVIIVGRYLNLEQVDIHRNNEWIALVKDFALVDEFPPAIMLYAKLLTWRGENAAAAELLEQKILPYIKPTSVRPSPWEDLTMKALLDSPLRMYGLAIAEAQGVEGAKNAMRRAALEFNEPIALTELASIQLESEDWDLYEQYMSLAAVGPYGPACLYLANFYYRISQGEIPTQEERDRKRQEENSAGQLRTRLFGPLFKRIDKAINKPMDRETYRRLAIEWYALAVELDQNEARFILAMLWREDGFIEKSRVLFDEFIQLGLPSSVPKKGLLEMEDQWNDPTFNPGLPPKLLKLS